ncbi:MAG: hypothetical protein IJX39_08725 [Clostridia bacterium]|nr:hypothetical protein [Clostridia bacterium]
MSNNEYVIRIEDGTSQSSAAPVASKNPGAEQKGQPKQTKPANAMDYIASKMVSPMVKQVTTFATASVGIETGSQELQQKTDLAMNAIQTVLSGWSTIQGATALIGGPVGVAVGVATAAMGIAVQYGIKQAQIKQQMRLEEEQLALYRSRFGIGFNQSRTGGT